MKTLFLLSFFLSFSSIGSECNGPQDVTMNAYDLNEDLSDCFHSSWRFGFDNIEDAIDYAKSVFGTNQDFYYSAISDENINWCKTRFSNPTKLYVSEVSVYGKKPHNKYGCEVFRKRTDPVLNFLLN